MVIELINDLRNLLFIIIAISIVVISRKVCINISVGVGIDFFLVYGTALCLAGWASSLDMLSQANTGSFGSHQHMHTYPDIGVAKLAHTWQIIDI